MCYVLGSLKVSLAFGRTCERHLSPCVLLQKNTPPLCWLVWCCRRIGGKQHVNTVLVSIFGLPLFFVLYFLNSATTGHFLAIKMTEWTRAVKMHHNECRVFCNKHITAAGTAWFPLILPWTSSRTSSYPQQMALERSHESRNLLLSWFQVSWRQHIEGFICRRKRRRLFLFIISVSEFYCLYIPSCVTPGSYRPARVSATVFLKDLQFIWNSHKWIRMLFCSSVCSTRSHRG